MSFKIGNTSFGFTMRVPDGDEKAVDDLLSVMQIGCLKHIL
ncbi:hypothetical protein N9L98_00510 [bacterium]|nr:hypothetical protein [bacterium]